MGRCWKHSDERLEGPECTVNGLSLDTRQDRPMLLQCECVTPFEIAPDRFPLFLVHGKTSFQDEGPAATVTSHLPGKAFWVSLSVSLLLVIIAISLKGHLGTPRIDSQVNASEAAGPSPAGVHQRMLLLLPADCSNHRSRPEWHPCQPVCCRGPEE